MRGAGTGMKTILAVGAFSCLAWSCGPPHIAPFTPRERKYDTGEYEMDQDRSKPSAGSIYTEGMAGYLEDTRADLGQLFRHGLALAIGVLRNEGAYGAHESHQ